MQSEDKDVCVSVPEARYKKYMYLKYCLAKRSAGEILPERKTNTEINGEHQEKVSAIISRSFEDNENYIQDKHIGMETASTIIARQPCGNRSSENVVLEGGIISKQVGGRLGKMEDVFVGKLTDTCFCIMARDYKGISNGITTIIEADIKIANPENKSQAAKVHETDGVFSTLCSGTHGYAMGYVKDEEIKQVCCGIRGRNTGDKLEQVIELKDGSTNTLTTVEKDNMIIELTQGVSQAHRVYDPNGISVCLNSLSGGVGARTGLYILPKEDKPRVTLEDIINNKYRIRRLTPIETARLQGFADDWNEFGIDEKGEKVRISDTQRYKQAGNAVTTYVIANMGLAIALELSKKKE